MLKINILSGKKVMRTKIAALQKKVIYTLRSENKIGN